MAEFKRQALINWDYIKNNISLVSNDTATAGDLNSYEFIISLVNADTVDLTGYKLTTLYSSQSTLNSGIIAPVAGENNIYTVQLPSEMFVAGTYDVCLSLSNEEEILGSVLFNFKISKNLMTEVSEAVNNNLTDFQKLFLAQLPNDIVERLNAQVALIDAKVDKTAIIDMAHGGTGAAARANAIDNLISIPQNAINTAELDTTANWSKYKTCEMTVSNTTNGLYPTNYGRILSFHQDSGISQLFFSESSGYLFHRQGNVSAGWSGNGAVGSNSWARISDSTSPLPILSSDSSSTGLAYTLKSAILPSTLRSGYSFTFVPTITSTAQTATLAINGGTAYSFAKTNSYTGDKTNLNASNAPVNFLKANAAYNLTFTGTQFAISDEMLIDAQSLSGALPINTVISNTSSTASGYVFGTWSNIGSQTVGSTVVYYWKRTA